MMYGSYFNQMFGWGFSNGFMMLLFWIGLILLVIWGVRGINGGGCGSMRDHGHAKTALDILKERYAKGEIDKSEYETKRKDLEK